MRQEIKVVSGEPINIQPSIDTYNLDLSDFFERKRWGSIDLRLSSGQRSRAWVRTPQGTIRGGREMNIVVSVGPLTREEESKIAVGFLFQGKRYGASLYGDYDMDKHYGESWRRSLFLTDLDLPGKHISPEFDRGTTDLQIIFDQISAICS